MRQKRIWRGQTIIEVLVALTAGIVIISAITVSLVSGLSNAQYSRDQSAATRYAQEGIEIARRMRDTDFQEFDKTNGHFCLAKNCTTVKDKKNNKCGEVKGNKNCGENVDKFIREIFLRKGTPDCKGAKKVTVSVKWKDSRCKSGEYCHETKLVSCLSEVGSGL